MIKWQDKFFSLDGKEHFCSSEATGEFLYAKINAKYPSKGHWPIYECYVRVGGQYDWLPGYSPSFKTVEEAKEWAEEETKNLANQYLDRCENNARKARRLLTKKKKRPFHL